MLTQQTATVRPHAGSAPQPIIKTCTAVATPTPSTVVATATTEAPQPKMDLLGDLGGDPFGEALVVHEILHAVGGSSFGVGVI